VHNWARKRIPEAFLVLSGVAVVVVTGLSDVPEIVPWGHELGILVSTLGWAFVGGYAVNQLLVDRPKAQALRGWYSATQDGLTHMALLPQRALTVLLAQVAPDSLSPLHGISKDELVEVLSSVDWSIETNILKLQRVTQINMADRDRAYELLKPLLGHFEPAVAVRIVALYAEVAPRIMQSYADRRDISAASGTIEHFAEMLVDYQLAGQRLVEAIVADRYMPLMAKQIRDGDTYERLTATPHR
jgi:hypothetical protein